MIVSYSGRLPLDQRLFIADTWGQAHSSASAPWLALLLNGVDFDGSARVLLRNGGDNAKRMWRLALEDGSKQYLKLVLAELLSLQLNGPDLAAAISTLYELYQTEPKCRQSLQLLLRELAPYLQRRREYLSVDIAKLRSVPSASWALPTAKLRYEVHDTTILKFLQDSASATRLSKPSGIREARKARREDQDAGGWQASPGHADRQGQGSRGGCSENRQLGKLA